MKLVKINQKEYDILKELDDKWKWIARDQNHSHLSYGYLFAYANKPSKSPLTDGWKSSDGGWLVLVDNDLFQFIKWEDEESYSIAELIEEFESSLIKSTPWTPNPLDFEIEPFKNAKIVNVDVGKITGSVHQFKDFDESEETEVKKMDKIELKQALGDIKHYGEYRGLFGIGWDRRISILENLIDQLDEPEKPVIPQFVAEWIEEAKRNESWGIVGLINSFRNGIVQAPCKTRKYFDENPRNVILAYLNGYTVEEKKYEVKDKNDCFLLTKNSEGEVINAYSKVVYKNKGQLTEQEIKDYDERYWLFAVPVEVEEASE